MKRINSVLTLGASLLLLALGQSQAHAYTHPGVPNSREELDTIKDNLDKQPWKQGYALHAAVHSGKVADVEGPSTADGAKVYQWNYVGALNQQWRISASSTAP